MVIPHRNGPLYSTFAKRAGVVEFVGSKAIRVVYDNDEKEIVEIGTVMGKWSGKIIPHRLVTPLKTGDKVKDGDVIAYNTHFFKPDPLFPGQLGLTIGTLGYFTIQDRRETYEDCSVLHERFAKKMVTTSTHMRGVLIDFDLEVRNLLKVGDHVESDSILCTLYPRQGGDSSLFDERSLSTLQRVNALNPKAQNAGVIEKIEVLYTGDMEYMSDTLRQIAQDADDRIAVERRQLKLPSVDGMVEVGFRSDSFVLGPNQALLKVYITHEVSYAAGDKKVLGLQLKSVTGKIIGGRFETESGDELDGIFSGESIEKRIVDSPIRGATSNTLSVHFSKMFVEVYRGAGG